MAEKIKDLTELFSGSIGYENLAGDVAFHSEYYIQAAIHYKRALEYAVKKWREQNNKGNVPIDEIKNVVIGEICYSVYHSLRYQEIQDPNSPLLKDFYLNEPLPVKCDTMEQRKLAVKRKYLRYSADNDYSGGMAEFALACMGRGPSNGCAFSPITSLNKKYAIEWADYMFQKPQAFPKYTAYCIYAMYYMDKYADEPTRKNYFNFANNIFKAHNLFYEKEKDGIPLEGNALVRQMIYYHKGIAHSFRNKGTTDDVEQYRDLKASERFYESAMSSKSPNDLDPAIVKSAAKLKDANRKQREIEENKTRKKR